MNLFLHRKMLRAPWNMSSLCISSGRDDFLRQRLLYRYRLSCATRGILRSTRFVISRSLASICLQSDRHSSWISIEYWSPYETKTSNLPWSTCLPRGPDERHLPPVSLVRWAEHNRDFLQSHSSPLEFYLHRSEYLRLLTPDPFEQSKAIEYANKYLQPFFATHSAELKRLMGCLIFLPKERMQNSPYEDLTSEAIHLDLENIFATEFSASLGMSKRPPLRVVGDIGGGGALAKIEKGRKIMRERKSEWSQSDELPVSSLPLGLFRFVLLNLVKIEIPLPPENRYHSVFACPVSKDQSTEQNPPMMMNCGHVVSKDSLQKLSKTSGYVVTFPFPWVFLMHDVSAG